MPRRTGPGPFVVLGIIALIPAIALYAVYGWSRGNIDDNEPAPPAPSPVVDPPLPADPLANAVLSFRRLPAVVSRDLNVERFRADVVPLLGSLNDLSCVAISVDGEPIGEYNAELPVIPASNMKLVVAATALEILGPEHRFRTSVVAQAAPADGIVEGDLALVGGGDPLLSSDWYPTSDLERLPVFDATSLDSLADSVVDAGVTRVTGAVLGDGSRYDDEFFAPGWGIGVAGLEAGPYDALLANDGRVLGEDQRSPDPNAGAAREFARLLTERGIQVAGTAASGAAAGSSEIASIESVPLSDVVAEMLTNSDNNTAELLVKEIGLGPDPADPTGATRQAGLDAMTAQLADWGIDTTGIAFADGSGLGLANTITCGALLAVLQRFESDGPLGAGLPVAAESGALADVFADTPVAGRLLGKTGTLNNPPFNQDPPAVKALSGYLPVDGGGAVEYTLVLNGPTISDQSEYRPIWGSLVDVLDGYPSGPSPADLGLVE